MKGWFFANCIVSASNVYHFVPGDPWQKWQAAMAILFFLLAIRAAVFEAAASK